MQEASCSNLNNDVWKSYLQVEPLGERLRIECYAYASLGDNEDT